MCIRDRYLMILNILFEFQQVSIIFLLINYFRFLDSTKISKINMLEEKSNQNRYFNYILISCQEQEAFREKPQHSSINKQREKRFYLLKLEFQLTFFLVYRSQVICKELNNAYQDQNQY
eukprot:TRINITY_DN20014_c0_g2_i2.p2 TRINITY_DN20014_c0_g2~~TRINITY_DN20014_c0_g2_i2.p2  ORF type:complete len:119 (+),score=12.06 TRINITY_DN20014_c0_g2_i2:158-514(+)